MSSENAPIDLNMLDTTFGKDGRQDIICTFIEHSRLLFSRMETGFDQKDAEVVIDVAHQIKGMGASIFAQPLSIQANHLERLAKQENPDWHEIGESLEAVKKCFAVVSAFLNNQN